MRRDVAVIADDGDACQGTARRGNFRHGVVQLSRCSRAATRGKETREGRVTVMNGIVLARNPWHADTALLPETLIAPTLTDRVEPMSAAGIPVSSVWSPPSFPAILTPPPPTTTTTHTHTHTHTHSSLSLSLTHTHTYTQRHAARARTHTYFLSRHAKAVLKSYAKLFLIKARTVFPDQGMQKSL